MEKHKTFGVLQRIGRSFMLPLALLPIAGLLLGIGSSFTNETMLAAYGLSGVIHKGTPIYVILDIMSKTGSVVFNNLPLLFAMGVAIGMAKKEKAVAALSSGVAFLIMNTTISTLIAAKGGVSAMPANSTTSVLGITTLQMGVFGGIIVGLGVAALHNKFYEIQLPQVLSFFGGTHFIPIISSVTFLLVGILMFFVWPVIQTGIAALGNLVLSSGYIGTWIYGIIERALMPFGLHHVFYPPFLYEFGRFTDPATGEILKGEAARYFAGDPTAGYFMASEFPIMLFGLPAATLAMYLRAKKEKKKSVAGMMLTAAVTSILTGITEPIEFSFIFVAPLLYVFHVLAAFLSGVLTKALNIRLGYTFSASLIDYVLGISNSQNGWKLFLIVGPIIGILYFVVFYYAIKIFDYKTPGREDDGETESPQENKNLDKSSRAAKVLEALGGKENIDVIDACITRLRLTVYDTAKVDKARLKALGAAGTMDAGGGNIQVVFGTEAEMLKDEIKKIM